MGCVASKHGHQMAVDYLIETKKVALFCGSKYKCCQRVIDIITQYNLPPSLFHIWDFKEDPKAADIRQYLVALTNFNGDFWAFIDGRFVGSCGEMISLHSQGHLIKLFIDVL